MSEDQCDFGMLGVAPSLGQNLGRFRCLTLRRQNPSRDGSGGNERRRKVEGLSRIGKRLSLLRILEFDCELCQQKRAAPVGFGSSKMTVLLGDLECVERRSPIALTALHFKK